MATPEILTRMRVMRFSITMTKLLTATQMRSIEQAAITSGHVTGLELMERAGQGVVEAILEWWPELAIASYRALVLCGPGNNGGDGFVVARLLHQRGWEVEVFLYGDEARLPPDAAENARRWRKMGAIAPLKGNSLVDRDPALDHLIVDALFGTGLTRPIVGLEGVLGFLEDSADCFELGTVQAPVVAVDIASGICANSGRDLLHTGVQSVTHTTANLTVTFHAPKIGHFIDIGPACCRRLVVKDIGLTSIPDVDCADLVGSAKGTSLKHHLDHKYDHGHALILSGGPGKGGAARLAARGALRIGAGLVTVACLPEAMPENAARLDAIMLAPVGDLGSLAEQLEARKIRAVCIGPGFGIGERLRDFVATLLALKMTVVLDADALTEFQDDPKTLFGMLHSSCVLTPHEGEFGRLFPDILAKLKQPATTGPAYSKVDATREAACRAGCVVLFKGADTVIADPSGRCSINSAHYARAAPWLATAGSGDVLAGFITGLLARGFDLMRAVECAAWLHVQCALEFGPGLIAEDLPEQLPAVLRDLGL